MFKLVLPPCPEDYGCSSVPGTWWAFGGALEPIPKSCQEWSNSWELMLPVGSLLHPPPLDNALNPLPSILPDSLSLDLRDVLLSVICQISVCFGECYLHIDSKALLLLAFSIHWAAHFPLGAELRFLFVSFRISPWRILNTQLFFCPIRSSRS